VHRLAKAGYERSVAAAVAVVVLRKVHHAVAAQVEIESKSLKQMTVLQLQVLDYRRFQHGFDRINMHRPTTQLERGARTPSQSTWVTRGVAAQVEVESRFRV